MDAPLARLLDAPQGFGFFQAMRLLLQARAAAAGAPPPASRTELMHAVDAVARLGATDSSAFPPGEIQSLYAPEPAAPADGGPAAPARIRVNFMGLTGPSGVLPLHYTEWLAQRRRARDAAPGAFLDIFNHRVLAMFWYAWARSRPGIMQEQAGSQGALRHVLDLIGMGTRGLLPEPGAARAANSANSANTVRATPPASELGYYSGLISQRPHSSAMLAQIMADACRAPVSAEPCLGTWQAVPVRQLTRLGDRQSQLGQGMVLGERYWDRQTTLRLRIGPLDRARFESLLPGGGQLERAAALARFLTGLSLDLRIQLRLAARDVTPVRLDGGPARQSGPAGMPSGPDAGRGPRRAARARLGWNTWLAGRRDPGPASECEFHFHATGGQSWR